jgi:hypothetical protein
VLKAAKALDGQVAFFYISASEGAFAPLFDAAAAAAKYGE